MIHTMSRLKYVLRVLIVVGIFATIVESTAGVRRVERFTLVSESGLVSTYPQLNQRSLLRLAFAAISLSLL
jgi:hypothetical protein